MTTSTVDLKKLYSKDKKKKILVIFSIFLALIVTILISLSFGASSPRLSEALTVIFSKTFPFLNIGSASPLSETIIWTIRLPRIVLAIIAGAGLATAGATMQGILRNPLVSSYILGISSAAGFGAALAIVFGVSIATFAGYLVIGNAFIFCLIAMVIVYSIARIRGMSSESVILAGVAVGFLFSALLSLIQYIAPERNAVTAIVFWLMGGLYTASWQNILICLPIVAIAMILMMTQAWNINVLSMGEDVAVSLGVNSKRILSINMILETVATASIISFTGIIGFVDLIAPHISRMLIGNDHRYLIPCSALMGALMLLGADTVARLIIMPTELPVGIVTSLIGVPFFIYLLIHKRRHRFS
ncbi:MAG: iron ABC transporter permease [Candidatus Bathyarchaeota archaeon]|uniref:FecCD family ABC transporter permease n=1 Tax=Candidatus Bathycorpusculum sp. TaxID=2994959 RepID=UPI0028351488|nr:iron ABC transporter permease [Candidatus Termiticorpusculum sp.]MCL2256660.1 iron ABC transporter permease [Candidatus Termiticorpusculum sp.]MCL2292801.1 iron ABC transporter permease [Candidatus Termiticorpusculum sp.]